MESIYMEVESDTDVSIYSSNDTSGTESETETNEETAQHPPAVDLPAISNSETAVVEVPILDQQYDEDAQEMHISEGAEAREVAKKEVISTEQCNKSPVRRSLEKSSDEDGQMCTICFEAWTNSGDHRLVSLKCGHLFGFGCINRWLKGQGSKCPQCNASAKRADIRTLYARSLKVLDTTERDRALKDLEKESTLRRKVELEAAQTRLKYQLAQQECERLKKELIETKMQLRELRSSGRASEKCTEATTSSQSLFKLEKTLDLCKQGGCRVIDICDLLGMLVVSQPSSNTLFPGYGLKKISTSDFKAAEFVWVHQKQIKDISFHSHDGLILTASLDRTVKITNVLTNSVVQSYSLDSDVWSCTWDRDDPCYFFAGLKNGSVFEFDIRMTTGHVSQLPSMGQNSPVIALQYLRKLPTAKYGKAGLLVGHLSSCCFYVKDDSDLTYNVVPLPLEGKFTSLSSEPGIGHFLASCRPSAKHPKVTHMLCELSFNDCNVSPCCCNVVQTMYGGSTQVHLSRSKLLAHPNNDSSVLVCAGDEASQAALIWDGSTGQSLHQLQADSPVLDLTSFRINHQSLFATLTEKNLRLYSWCGS